MCATRVGSMRAKRGSITHWASSGVTCHLRVPSPLTRPCRCPRPRSSRCHRAARQRRCSPGRRHRAPRPPGVSSSCGERPGAGGRGLSPLSAAQRGVCCRGKPSRHTSPRGRARPRRLSRPASRPSAAPPPLAWSRTCRHAGPAPRAPQAFSGAASQGSS